MSTIINPQELYSSHLKALRLFISKRLYKTEKGNDETNLFDTTPNNSGTWILRKDDAPEFFELYQKCVGSNLELHFVEKSKKDGSRGIMIDLDIYQTSSVRLISVESLKYLVRDIYRLIVDNISEGADAIHHAYVIAKPEVVKVDNKMHEGNMVFKDGMHILFPTIQVPKQFRKWLLDTIADKGILEDNLEADMNGRHIGPIVDMLDRNSAHVPVYLFGSCKNGGTKYDLIKKYECKTLHRRSYPEYSIDEIRFANAIEETANMSLVHHVGTIKKITCVPHEDIMKEDTPEIEEEEIGNANADADPDLDMFTSQNAEAAYLKSLLDILPDSFARDYDKWRSVLCALAHCGDRFKCVARAFSKRCPEKYSEIYFEESWENARLGRTDKPLTKRSIIYWARKHSPEKYQEVHKKSYFNILYQAVMDSQGIIEHGHIAQVLEIMIANKYCYDGTVDRKSKRNVGGAWYEFIFPEDDHLHGELYKWRLQPDGDSIMKYMMRNLPSVYNDILVFIEKRIEEAGDDKAASKYWNFMFKNVKASKRNLQKIPYIRGCMDALRLFLRRLGFTAELDSYSNVIGVANGVLRVGPRTEFINRYHEYRISTGIVTSYRDYDKTNPYIIKVKQLFKDIIPEKDARRKIRMILSTGLDRRPGTMGVFFNGGGSNGKSTLSTIVQNTLGLDICGTLRMSVLTGKDAEANQADSAFMKAKGKTLLFLDEANQGDILNPKKVKNLINAGVMSGRDLYGAEENIKLHCNFVSLSNYPLIINCSDWGLWRRICCYNAKVKFVKDPEEGNMFEKKIDRSYEMEVINDRRYLEATLSILCHDYEKLWDLYDGDIHSIPSETIDNETRIYRKSQDRLYNFCLDMLVKSPNTNTTIEDLCNTYVTWLKKQYGLVMSLTDAQASFENSSIRKHIKTNGRHKNLEGYRICLDGNLLEGEEDFE